MARDVKILKRVVSEETKTSGKSRVKLR
jgi:hypothetical protein